MHDVVADKISLISVRAGALVAVSASGELRPEQVRTEANTIRGLSRTTLTELREVIMVLRDPAERTDEGLDRIPALVADSGLDAESDHAGERVREPMGSGVTADRLPDRAGGADQHPQVRAGGSGHRRVGRDRRSGWSSPSATARPSGRNPTTGCLPAGTAWSG